MFLSIVASAQQVRKHAFYEFEVRTKCSINRSRLATIDHKLLAKRKQLQSRIDREQATDRDINLHSVSVALTTISFFVIANDYSRLIRVITDAHRNHR